MIGSYGRNAYGGRVGGRRNRRINTLSPKGGQLRLVKTIGILGKSSVIGKTRITKSIGSIDIPSMKGKSKVNKTVGILIFKG